MKNLPTLAFLSAALIACGGPGEVTEAPEEGEVLGVTIFSRAVVAGAAEFPDTIRFTAGVDFEGNISDSVSFRAQFGTIIFDWKRMRTWTGGQEGVAVTVKSWWYEGLYTPPFEEATDTVWAVSAADATKSNFKTVDVTLADEGYIAFSATGVSEDDDGIYVIRPDGTGLWRVTADLAPDAAPAWSPDGMRVFYAGSRVLLPGEVIFALTPNGSDLVELTSEIHSATFPAMASDGERLAFVGTPEPSDPSEIWVLNINTQELTQITDEGIVSGNHPTSPSWSPDGARIAYTTFRDGNGEVYVANADGSGHINLSNNPDAEDGQPSWSPDGTTIAFWSDADGGGIYLMNPDGSGRIKVVDAGGNPAWSPDGAWILFTRDTGGNIDLWKMEIDTGEEVRITDTPDWDERAAPAWGVPIRSPG